jgi:hypothetical protein
VFKSDCSADLGAHSDEVWNYVACLYGFECGSRNLYVNSSCANAGHCASDYIGYLREYALTPDEFARVERNAQLISGAIARGDWSVFTFVPDAGTTITLSQGLQRIRIR